MMIGNTANTINMTYNAVTATNKAIEKTARALSTGLRTATAADDAAGFAMGMSMSAQVAGVDRAIRNTQDGISMLQVAEGGLGQINSALQRMRELSVQAANDTLTAQDRSYIQTEIAELRENINNAVNTTTFNRRRLLDGSSTAQWTSDKAATQLKVSGAITATDKYGQRKLTEGNYKIQITAKPGRGQVQKTNIIDLDTVEEIATTETTYKRDNDGNIITDDNGDPVEIEVAVTEKRLHPATLENIKSFRTASGVSYFTEPQTIRITQGDGKTANIFVYGGDTVEDVRRKINEAISDDLGQGQYVDNRENFCTISDGTPGTSEAVTGYEDVMTCQRDSDGKIIVDANGKPLMAAGELQIRRGTLLIRSAVAGRAGELSFSSDNEDLLNALGLSTIQTSEENTFAATVYNAHTGEYLARNADTVGNVIQGVIHPYADIEFDSMAAT